MSNKSKHEGGTEALAVRIPKDLRDRLSAVAAERGRPLSEIVIEALRLQGSFTVSLPDILERRARKFAADAGITFDECIEVALRALMDGPPVDKPADKPGRQEPRPIQYKSVSAVDALVDAPFGKSVSEFLASKGGELDGRSPGGKPIWPQAEVPMLENEEHGPSWSEVFAAAKSQGDFGAEWFADQVAHIGNFPNGFSRWPQVKQVDWLDKFHPLEHK